ncbi:MAG: hypothetical protein H8E45_12115 [Proteobacteria bacterium]|nr:hypothetical protein [Pseudomonadota bacterium]
MASVETVEFSLVSEYRKGIFVGSNSLLLSENMVSGGAWGIDMSLSTSSLKLVHNRVTGCGIGVWLPNGARFNDSVNASKHNIFVGNGISDVADWSIDSFNLTKNLCLKDHPSMSWNHCPGAVLLSGWAQFKP